jgi:CheY-like chemotaxis protein
MTSSRILVIEDNESNLRLVTFLLSSQGYEVRTAANAIEALKVLDDFHPDLILIDLGLPGMDGYQLTRRLKTAPATRDITIVALTAFAMRGDEEKALAAGCDGYLTKPIDTRSFRQRVAEFLAARPSSGADRG